uniref:DDE Tnp4 domain-containing protein n=1 Tax=Bactrocera dorsalis TaxID=27457 RepID=A0A034WPJ8_BACDO
MLIIVVNIGAKGSGSDGGVFNECKFNEKLQNNQLNIPPNRPLLNREKEIPFVIVADDAFPLQKHIMKPYSKRNLTMPEKIFNYRLSRARRVIENAFGIALARFIC